jgi:hypothetical protein
LAEQSSVSYSFKYGVIHLQGKGFLGYKQISTNNNNGTKTKSYQFLELNRDLISLLPSKTIEADFANNSLVESSSTFVNTPRSSLNTFNTKLQTMSSLVKKYKLNPASINSSSDPVSLVNDNVFPYTPIYNNFSYDGNGNVLTESQNIGGGLQQTYTVYSNYNSNGGWLPNKPESVSTTVTRQGQDPISSSIAFEYYENGSLKKKTIHPNLPKKIITEYEYFATGNLEKEKVSCEDGSFAPKISLNTYDTKFRFPKENNTQGEIAKWEYEPKYGIKTKETAPNGWSSTFEFENFGRVNSSKDFLGNQVHIYNAIFALEVYKLYQNLPRLDTTLAFTLESLQQVHVDFLSEYALTLGKSTQGVNNFKNNLQALTDKSKLLNAQSVNKPVQDALKLSKVY